MTGESRIVAGTPRVVRRRLILSCLGLTLGLGGLIYSLRAMPEWQVPAWVWVVFLGQGLVWALRALVREDPVELDLDFDQLTIGPPWARQRLSASDVIAVQLLALTPTPVTHSNRIHTRVFYQVNLVFGDSRNGRINVTSLWNVVPRSGVGQSHHDAARLATALSVPLIDQATCRAAL